MRRTPREHSVTGPPLLAAASLFAAATVASTIVAWRNPHLPSEPLGVRAAAGAAVLVGTLADPVSWGRRPRDGAVKATVVLHLLSGSALFLAGAWGNAPEQAPPR